MRQAARKRQRNVLRRRHLWHDRRRIGRVLWVKEAAQQQHRQNGADARERDQTEAVARRVLVAAHRRHAYAHRHDERHGDRPGRHAAGIIRHGQKTLGHEDGHRRQQAVEHHQQLRQADALQNAHDRQRQKRAHAHRDGINQHLVRDGGHLLGKHLQIRLSDGDDDAHHKRDGDNQRDFLHPLHLHADAFAQRRHRHFRAELKQPHAEHQQHRADRKHHRRAHVHRHQRHAQRQHDERDGQHRHQGFQQLLLELGVHYIAFLSDSKF